MSIRSSQPIPRRAASRILPRVRRCAARFPRTTVARREARINRVPTATKIRIRYARNYRQWLRSVGYRPIHLLPVCRCVGAARKDCLWPRPCKNCWGPFSAAHFQPVRSISYEFAFRMARCRTHAACIL